MIDILAVMRGVAPDAIEREFEGLRYGDFKTAVGDEVADWLAPVRERYGELRGDEDALEDILEAGARRRGRSPRHAGGRARRDGRRPRAAPQPAPGVIRRAGA